MNVHRGACSVTFTACLIHGLAPCVHAAVKQLQLPTSYGAVSAIIGTLHIYLQNTPYGVQRLFLMLLFLTNLIPAVGQNTGQFYLGLTTSMQLWRRQASLTSRAPVFNKLTPSCVGHGLLELGAVLSTHTCYKRLAGPETVHRGAVRNSVLFKLYRHWCASIQLSVV